MAVLIAGVDFSAATDLRRGQLWCAWGWLVGRRLRLVGLERVWQRETLVVRIRDQPGHWGIDAPMGLPVGVYPLLGWRDAPEAISRVAAMTRTDFRALLARYGLREERRCRAPGLTCRYADAYLQGLSPFKRTNPDMQMLVHASFRLLDRLRGMGVRVYPYDPQPTDGVSAVYEVYPSAVWRLLGFRRRQVDLQPALARIAWALRLQVELAGLGESPTQDAADAVLAAVAVGWAVAQEEVAEWHRKPASLTEEEWAVRAWEGAVIGPRMT